MLNSTIPPGVYYLLLLASSFVVGVLAHWITNEHPALCTCVASLYYVICSLVWQKETTEHNDS
jgi:hypothetical protein